MTSPSCMRDEKGTNQKSIEERKMVFAFMPGQENILLIERKSQIRRGVFLTRGGGRRKSTGKKKERERHVVMLSK